MADLTTCAPLDPEIAAALAALPIDIGALLGGLTDDTIADARAAMAQMPVPELSAAVERTDHEVPGSAGRRRAGPPSRRGDRRPAVPVLDARRRARARELRGRRPPLRSLVPAVRHRRRLGRVPPGPRDAVPGPLEDCYAGLAWVHEHAADLGVDPDRIGIGGPSAGGNLAAGLGLLARDRGRGAVRLPAADLPDARRPPDHARRAAGRTRSGRRAPTPTAGPPTSARPRAAPDVPAYAAPARATDLAGLPPTLIAVGAIDGFSDEDIDYAVRLRQAGVSVDLHVYAGAPHGFDGLAPGTAVARRANRDIEEWLAAPARRRLIAVGRGPAARSARQVVPWHG